MLGISALVGRRHRDIQDLGAGGEVEAQARDEDNYVHAPREVVDAEYGLFIHQASGVHEEREQRFLEVDTGAFPLNARQRRVGM